MSTKCLTIEELGEIEFTKRAKTKNIRISLRPFESIKVFIPKWASYDDAIKFVRSKITWIQRSKSKIEKIENKLTIFSHENIFKTKFHELILIESNSSTIHYRISNGKIKFHYPKDQDIKNQEIQNKIREAIELALRKEAKEFLPKRLCELAYKHQLAFNRCFIKNTRTQWGSCSRENNVNLSIHLMRLPEELIDYVLLHELTHTIHKNHSKKFWDFLSSLTNGKAKFLDRELNNYQIKIF